MLTLTRKVGERICVGPDIIIEVREIRRTHVRLSIIAPPDCDIWREELTGFARTKPTGEGHDERR
jgi:carbon storage regulator CsrA